MEEKKEVAEVRGFLNEPLEYGKIFAESGVFPDVKSAAQGAVKILAGREIGLSPMQSNNSFYFVGGKLGMLTQTMAAIIKKSGKYDYQIINHTIETCTIEFFKINGQREKIGESTFDKKMAAVAGIINKDSWKNYPINMCFNRALANGARWFCPDVICGFYTVEELQDITTIDVKPTVVSIDVSEEVTNGAKV